MTDNDKIIEYKAATDEIREDLDFIRARFEEAGLPMPESLSADAMRQKLEQLSAGASGETAATGAPGEPASQAPTPKDAPTRKRYWRIGISIAACAEELTSDDMASAIGETAPAAEERIVLQAK